MRDDGDEIGQHGVADVVDPVGVFDDVDGGSGAGQRGGVDQAGEAAPSRVGVDFGCSRLGVSDAEQVVEQQQVVGGRAIQSRTDSGAGRFGVGARDAKTARSRRATAWNGMSAAWASQYVVNTSTPRCAAMSDSSDVMRLLPIPGGPTTCDGACAGDGLLEDPSQRRQFPCTPDQGGVVSTMASGIACTEQSMRGDRGVGAFDADRFGFTEHGDVTDQMRGGVADHHPAGRCDRFHPLGHTDVHADGGVTTWAGIDVARDDLTRVQPDAQPEVDAVTRQRLGGQRAHRMLDVQRRQAGAKSVVLQSDWRPEQSHDAVAGELVDGAAVPLHHSGGPVEHGGHDVAQSFGVEAGRQIHRAHDVGEQHRHVFVLGRRRGVGDRSTTAVAEPRPARGLVPHVPQTRSVPPMRCDLPRSRMASGAVAKPSSRERQYRFRRVRRACPRAVRRRRRSRPRTCRAGRTTPRSRRARPIGPACRGRA